MYRHRLCEVVFFEVGRTQRRWFVGAMWKCMKNVRRMLVSLSCNSRGLLGASPASTQRDGCGNDKKPTMRRSYPFLAWLRVMAQIGLAR